MPVEETHATALTPPARRSRGDEPHRHPGESEEYRRARQALLVEEIELRRHAERVAASVALPPGGQVPDDYHFVAEDGSDVSLSDLFGEHETLIIYSYMFGPEREAPCPMCTSLMGGFDHKIADITQRVAIASPPALRSSGCGGKQSRGWSDLPVYSDTSGDYTRAYVSAEDADMPAYNVFTRRDGVIRHFWSEEITGTWPIPARTRAARSRWTRCGFSWTPP